MITDIKVNMTEMCSCNQSKITDIHNCEKFDLNEIYSSGRQEIGFSYVMTKGTKWTQNTEFRIQCLDHIYVYEHIKKTCAYVKIMKMIKKDVIPENFKHILLYKRTINAIGLQVAELILKNSKHIK